MDIILIILWQYQFCSSFFFTKCLDPPTYCESVEGAVSILDDDDDPTQMGSVTFTPMYTFVYDYRRPPAYSEVNGQSTLE